MSQKIAPGRRVAVYARVSTARQAEADLSIPDQIRQAEAWCERHGVTLVGRYVEPGASGTDENRPMFQEMLTDAKLKPRPFDIILVHSLSRFCRDQFTWAITKRALSRTGITVQSMTQPLGDDATGEMVESILVAFDAYQSKENGKHTARAMKENARQGFWNGSHPPFGYRTIEGERRGEKVKKTLVVEPADAAIVQRIFSLYLGEEGRQHGVKAIASVLNTEGVMHRGKPFSISNVHRFLTRETYTGTHWFNVMDTTTRQARPRSEWVSMKVPVIIEQARFDRVQALLAERNPKKTPPRVVNNPTLLTGIAVCARCGGGMTMRTGKHNQYRYYTCAKRAQKGSTQCDGCTVPMPALDALVLDQLADRVFRPERLHILLEDFLADAADQEGQRRQDAGRVKAELTETEGAINRLVGMVEKGLMDVDDPALAGRMLVLKRQRQRLQQEVLTLSTPALRARRALTPAKLERLSAEMRTALRDGPPDLRKAYLRLFVDNVTVSRDEITISGAKSALARAAITDLPATSGEVLTFVQEWRPVGDSNPCWCRERALS